MNKLLLCLTMCAGCATLGQTKINSTEKEPSIKERIVSMPDTQQPGMRSGGGLRSYFDLPVNKVATAMNPLNTPIDAEILCNAAFPYKFDVKIPAHTSQDMLFTTNAEYMYQTLCHIENYEVSYEDKK
jgi:hypothetical protein